MYDPGSYSNLRENFVNDKYETFTFALILLQYHFITLHKSFSFNWQVGSSGFFKTTEKWWFMFFVFVEFHDRLSGTVVLSLECLLPQWSIRTFFSAPQTCAGAPYVRPPITNQVQVYSSEFKFHSNVGSLLASHVKRFIRFRTLFPRSFFYTFPVLTFMTFSQQLFLFFFNYNFVYFQFSFCLFLVYFLFIHSFNLLFLIVILRPNCVD